MVRRLYEMDSEDQEIHPYEPDEFKQYVDQLEYIVKCCDSLKEEVQNLLDYVKSNQDHYSNNIKLYGYKETMNAAGSIAIKIMLLRNKIRKLYK